MEIGKAANNNMEMGQAANNNMEMGKVANNNMEMGKAANNNMEMGKAANNNMEMGKAANNNMEMGKAANNMEMGKAANNMEMGKAANNNMEMGKVANNNMEMGKAANNNIEMGKAANNMEMGKAASSNMEMELVQSPKTLPNPSNDTQGADSESCHSDSVSVIEEETDEESIEETDEETAKSQSEREDSPKSSLVVAPDDQQIIQQQLKELNHKVSSALQEVVKEGKDLDLYTDLLLENRDKVKKQLQGHKLHLQRLVERHHQQQMDVFKNLYRQMMQQMLVTKTEEKNYQARLADLHHQVNEMLLNTERGKDPEKSCDELSIKRLTDLSDSFLQLLQKKPVMQVDRKMVKADLPDVAFEDLQELMGSVALWEDKDQLSDAPEPRQECCEDQQCGTSFNGFPTPAVTSERLPERMSQGLMGSVALWEDKDPLSDALESRQECLGSQQCGTSVNGFPTPTETSEHLPERMSPKHLCKTQTENLSDPGDTGRISGSSCPQILHEQRAETCSDSRDKNVTSRSSLPAGFHSQSDPGDKGRISGSSCPQILHEQMAETCSDTGDKDVTSRSSLPAGFHSQSDPGDKGRISGSSCPQILHEQMAETCSDSGDKDVTSRSSLPAGFHSQSDPGDKGRISGSACPQILHEQMAETCSDSGDKDMTSHSSLPAGFHSQSASSLNIGGASFASAPLIFTTRESTTLAAAKRWLHHEQVKQGKKFVFHGDPSQKEEQNSYWCKSSTPTEHKRNICKRGPLSEQNKILGREMIQSRYRELLALEAADTSTARSHRWKSVTTPPGSSPIKLPGRWINPSAIAPRCDGKMWVCYTFQGLLDLVDESGTICQSTQIGRSPKHLAAYGPTDVLVAHDSPQSLMLYMDGQERHALFGKCKYHAIAATTSGIVISSMFRGRIRSTIFWVPLEGDMTWVSVSHPDVDHQFVCSLALMTYNGKNVICAADKGRRVVHFFQQESSGEFTAHPSFCFDKEDNFMTRKSLKRRGRNPKECKYFTPVSVSAHPSGFVAVLDAAMTSVHFIDTIKLFECGLNGSQCTASVITWDRVTYGVPQMIAFSAGEHEKNEAKLWVGVDSGRLCIVPLLFLSW